MSETETHEDSHPPSWHHTRCVVERAAGERGREEGKWYDEVWGGEVRADAEV